MIKMTLNTVSFKRDMERFAKKSEDDFKKAVASSTLEMQKMAKKKVQQHTRGSKVRSGFLVNNINTTILNGGYTGEVISAANYSEAFENGTKPHIIRIRNKKVLAGARRGAPAGWKSGGRSASMGYATYGKEVRHPGTRPHPFMYPAWKHASNHLEKQIKAALR